jgi:hypothetical protein
VDRRLADRLAVAAAFLWPFLYLFPYVLPVHGTYLSIGNDFHILYFVYKAYLLDSLANFHLPLWSPSESAGFPFYANPFAETFYPLNLPLAAYYKLVGGYQVIDHQRFAVLGIAIFTIGLYCWLRSLRFGVRIALATAMVMGVSFKLTELLRFPNAVHTAAWYPWVLLFMTRLVGASTRRARVVNGVLLAGALICMVTGGYPYYVIYSPWLFGPYLLVLLVPRWSQALLDRKPADLKGAIAALAAAGLAVALVCAPYLYKMSALMQQTTDRAGKSFEYSTQHIFDYQDTIGSWVFPPASQMEGWYYFGLVNVLLVLLAIVRRPRHAVTLFLLAWFAVVTYITYGRNSYLFWLLWHYVPTYANLRVWARMNIVLVPILAWLVAIGYQHFESLLAGRGGDRERRRPDWRVILTVCALTGLVVAAQLHARAHEWHDGYWTNYYAPGIAHGKYIGGLIDYLAACGVKVAVTPETAVQAEQAFVLAAVVSGLALAAILTIAPFFRRAGQALPRLVAIAAVTIAAADMWVVGPWAWADTVLPAEGARTPYRIADRNTQSFDVPRRDWFGLSPSGSFAVGVMDNWYFERYVHFLGEGRKEPEALKQLLGMNDGRKIFFSERIGHPSIEAFLADANRFAQAARASRYTGDEITIRVSAPTPGFVSFIDNWDPDWTAAVDDTRVPIERLFGTFKSVPVPAGSHVVTFAYRPFGAW